ncbi:MAG: response regulator, partial [Myxococcota bacterium]
PAIALVDWNMPVMNGLELIRAIRAIRRYDEMPLLMVTTETETTQIARALAAGADEYAMKPFTREALASKLALLGVSAGARLHERSS